MTEVVFISGKNSVGKTQLAYELFGCSRAEDRVHYQPDEVRAGNVKFVQLGLCTVARLYDDGTGKKYLLLDGVNFGFEHLTQALDEAVKLGAEEVWIKGCYHRSMGKSQFVGYSYPASIRRVYFEYVADGHLITERDGQPINLHREAASRIEKSVRQMVEDSDKRLGKLRAARNRGKKTCEKLGVAMSVESAASDAVRNLRKVLGAATANLEQLEQQVASISDGLMLPVTQITGDDVPAFLEEVLSNSGIVELLPAIQMQTAVYLDALGKTCDADRAEKAASKAAKSAKLQVARYAGVIERLTGEEATNASLRDEIHQIEVELTIANDN